MDERASRPWPTIAFRCVGRRASARPIPLGSARHASVRGFSVIELMNFIALAALLSALGMYALARYVRHAKTAEAIGSVKSLATTAAAYYDASDSTQPAGTLPDAAHAMRHFPAPSKASVPPDIAMVRAKKYQSVIADWSGPPWSDLHFEIPQPQYYAYAFESQGTGQSARAAATARGDLDGDGRESTYRLTIAPDATFKAIVGKDIERTDPEE